MSGAAHTVGLMREHDRGYVFATWKRSYRTSLWAHEWPEDVYDAYMQRLIERLLLRGRVLIARPEGWAEGILGWACAEQAPDAFVLHYGYLRRRVRARQTGGPSIFWALVERLEPRGQLLYTHRNAPFTLAFERRGYTFAPERASIGEDYSHEQSD